MGLEPQSGSLQSLALEQNRAEQGDQVTVGMTLAQLREDRFALLERAGRKFQLGTHMACEAKRGRMGPLLRDATYTGVTPRFWGSLDRVAGPEAWVMYGLTNCGKGQPGQGAHVSHGASAARFRDVQVGVKS